MQFSRSTIGHFGAIHVHSLRQQRQHLCHQLLGRLLRIPKRYRSAGRPTATLFHGILHNLLTIGNQFVGRLRHADRLLLAQLDLRAEQLGKDVKQLIDRLVAKLLKRFAACLFVQAILFLGGGGARIDLRFELSVRDWCVLVVRKGYKFIWFLNI